MYSYCCVTLQEINVLHRTSKVTFAWIKRNFWISWCSNLLVKARSEHKKHLDIVRLFESPFVALCRLKCRIQLVINMSASDKANTMAVNCSIIVYLKWSQIKTRSHFSNFFVKFLRKWLTFLKKWHQFIRKLRSSSSIRQCKQHSSNELHLIWVDTLSWWKWIDLLWMHSMLNYTKLWRIEFLLGTRFHVRILFCSKTCTRICSFKCWHTCLSVLFDDWFVGYFITDKYWLRFLFVSAALLRLNLLGIVILEENLGSSSCFFP